VPQEDKHGIVHPVYSFCYINAAVFCKYRIFINILWSLKNVAQKTSQKLAILPCGVIMTKTEQGREYIYGIP